MTTEKQKSEFLDRVYKKHSKQISKILSWESPYLNFPNLVSLRTPGDGSCLFHSILKAYNKIAIDEKIGNNSVNMHEFIRSTFRQLLSEYLDDSCQHGVSVYRLLNENDFEKNSNSIIELTKDFMINELRSSAPVNFEYYSELLIRFCEKNIFVIDFEKQDVILSGSVSDKLRNDDWPCVVLLFCQGHGNVGHYETLGYMDTDGLHTYFSMSNVFIRYILYRATLLKEHSKIENIAEHIHKIGESQFYANVKAYVPSKGLLTETTQNTVKTIKKKESDEKEKKKSDSNNNLNTKKDKDKKIVNINKNNKDKKDKKAKEKIIIEDSSEEEKSSRTIVDNDDNDNNDEESIISLSDREKVNKIKNSLLAEDY
jgi:hypothetical protein